MFFLFVKYHIKRFCSFFFLHFIIVDIKIILSEKECKYVINFSFADNVNVR